MHTKIKQICLYMIIFIIALVNNNFDSKIFGLDSNNYPILILIKIFKNRLFQY